MERHCSLSVFILDDNPFSGTIYEQHICNLGYTDSTLITNAEDCLAQLARKPDIIFLDCRMKTLDGTDMVRRIGRLNPNIYLVVMADLEDVQLATDSLMHGAFDYIIKDNNDLDRIDAVLKKIKEVMRLLELRPPASPAPLGRLRL